MGFSDVSFTILLNKFDFSEFLFILSFIIALLNKVVFSEFLFVVSFIKELLNKVEFSVVEGLDKEENPPNPAKGFLRVSELWK